MVLILAGTVGLAAGAPLVTYEFNQGAAAPAIASANVSAADATWSVEGGGFSKSQGNAYVATGLTQGEFDDSKYLAVTVSAKNGYVLNPESFSFLLGGSRNSSGADFTVQAVVRTDADGYAANLALVPEPIASHAFHDTKPTFTEYTADLRDARYQGLKSLTFRIYVRSSSGSTQINLRIDNIRITGAVVSGESKTTSPAAAPASGNPRSSFNAPAPGLKLASLFTSGAVLQRNTGLPVWGTAKPGDKVTVQFAGQTVSVTADGAGKWKTELAPLAAENAGRDFTVESGGRKIALTNVVVGEVWLCSGQSNMEWPLKQDPKAEQLVARSDLPLIRQFKVKNLSAEALVDFAEGSWVSCSPETAGLFTALGYYFARDLHQKLGVPVGLINCSWGGTSIESWMSSRILEKFPEVAQRWEKILEGLPQKTAAYELERVEYKRKAAEAKANGTEFDWKKYPKPPPGPGTKEAPSGLFNGMIAPLIPYSIAGMLWYQGEANCGNAGRYAEMLPVFIQDLRQRWNAGNLPFYFVQLPNYNWDYDKTGAKWAEFRAAQMQVLSLPATGAAIIIDGKTPVGHPPDKTDVGLRLARLAEVRHYKIESGDACGPLLQSAVKDRKTVVLKFAEASSGLKTAGESLTGFELAGKDGAFVPAEARIDGEAVLVSAVNVAEPVAVRYAWANNPAASLYNGAGLPASPFSAEVK